MSGAMTEERMAPPRAEFRRSIGRGRGNGLRSNRPVASGPVPRNDSRPVTPSQNDDRFFKTKLCSFWEERRCLRGSGCKYAHGEEELSSAPDLTRTALCRELLRSGKCTIADCPFAHNHEELRYTDGFYKTAMCAFFLSGRCRLGSFCRHAHHEDELRPRDRESEKPNGFPKKGSSSSTQTSNAGDPTSNQTSAPDETDDDDELGDLPHPSTWDRTMTMPPALTEPPPRLPPGAWEKAPTSQPKVKAEAPSKSWVALTESEDVSDLDDLDGTPDMWSRLQTMPATMPSGMDSTCTSRVEEWKLQPLSMPEPSRRWSRQTTETTCPSVDQFLTGSCLPSEAVARGQAEGAPSLKEELQARRSAEVSKVWSRQSSDTTCWTSDTYVSSSTHPQRTCSSPSMSQDSCSLATSPEGARGPTDERSMVPTVVTMAMVPVMFIQGTPGTPAPTLHSAFLREQLEESARLLNAAAPDHYED